MSQWYLSVRRGILLTVVGALLSAAAGGDVAAASRRARGHFASNVVTEGCTSPVGICTAGTLTGGVNGTFVFTATSLQPTADTPTTGVLLYTGDIVLTTRFGTLTCKDAGAFESTGSGAVSSVCAVVGGTGNLTGAAGTVQFVGNFTFEGGGEGEYRAVIDVP